MMERRHFQMSGMKERGRERNRKGREYGSKEKLMRQRVEKKMVGQTERKC